MSKLKVPALLTEAEKHQKSGDMAAMEAVCREILTIRQDVPKVWQLLGLAAKTAGRKEEAVEMFQKALTFFPDSATALCDLSSSLLEVGKIEEALVSIEKLRKLQPNSAEAALAYGKYLFLKKKYPEAEAELARAIKINPKLPEAHLRHGNALREQGRSNEALSAFRKAIQLSPGYADAYVNYGALLWTTGDSQEAVAQYRKAIQINPQLFQARNNLGVALGDLNEHDEAIVQFRACLQINPNHAKAHNNLANALRNVGDYEEAFAEFERAIELAPDNPTFLSNAVFSCNYPPHFDAAKRYEMARRWAERFADPLLSQIEPHTNNRDPNRPLRIAYLSPDFGNHVVALFFAPIALGHRPEQCEVICYSNYASEDAVTTELKKLVPTWRNIAHLSDDEIAAKIREDQIDILVDLTLHSAGNRLGVFARKPAPVQVSYLGYIGTTGLKQIDYRLTDYYLDPNDRDDNIYSEKSIRFPDCAFCYNPLMQVPDVAPTPALKNGYVTFSCQSMFMKINDPLISLYAAVLNSVPNSRMHVYAHSLPQQQRLAAWFAKHGVSRGRIDFVPQVGRVEFLERHHQVDIALDTFPFTGVTTTLEAFLMGVPMLTICGYDAISRAGFSLAANLGLDEVLVASSPTDFVERAVRLASDFEKLNALRQEIRPRLGHSAIVNGKQFTENLENIYREMWHKWCAGSAR